MAVQVRCTHSDCGQPYKVAEEQVGRTVVCKKCNRSFILQASHRETLAEASHVDTVKPPVPPVRRTFVEPPLPSKPSAAAPANQELLAREAGVPEKIGRFEVHKRLGGGHSARCTGPMIRCWIVKWP